jgi:hypothetical protein
LKTLRSTRQSTDARKNLASNPSGPELTAATHLMLSRADAFVGNAKGWVAELKTLGAPRAYMVGVFKRIKNEGMVFFDDLDSEEELSDDWTSKT